MIERPTQKPANEVERADAVIAKAKPAVRLNGRDLEYATEGFNPKAMAKVLAKGIAKRKVSDD